jgi:hypothetical protein
VPLNIGGKSARFEALLGNKVPAAILDPPYTTMAAKEGYKLLVDLAPMDVPYLRNIVAVSEKSLREDSRTVSRFVAALAEGMQFNRNKSKILAKYLRLPLEKNRAMIEEGYETYRELMLKKPYADPSAMKILTAMIAEANPKARNIDPASLSIRLSSSSWKEKEFLIDESLATDGSNARTTYCGSSCRRPITRRQILASAIGCPCFDSVCASLRFFF